MKAEHHMSSTEQPAALEAEEVPDLAEDLIRGLAVRIGDSAAISTLMRAWFDRLGAQGVALVCIAAVRTTYAECLSVVPEVPPGATKFNPPAEGTCHD